MIVTNMVTCQRGCHQLGGSSPVSISVTLPTMVGKSRKSEPETLLKAARKAAGISVAELARRGKTSRQQIDRLEKGQRGLSREWAVRLAPHVGKQPSDLMFGPRTAHAVGYVGGGAQVIPIDDHVKGEGLEEVDMPPGVPENAVLVIVRGDSMHPRYFEGEFLFYVRDHRPARELVGREVVAQLADGRVFVKVLRPGTTPTSFNLESWNPTTPTMVDQVVEWAAPVIARVNRRGR